MKLKNIEYTLRKNLGNFEYEELKLISELEAKDNELEAIASLKLMAFDSLNPSPTIQPEQPKEEAIMPTQLTMELVYDKETSKDSDKKSSKKASKKAVKEEVVKKSDFVGYDRESVQHKAMITSLLNSAHPEWRKKPGISDFSKSLVGKDFVDSKGEIAESFKALIAEFFV